MEKKEKIITICYRIIILNNNQTLLYSQSLFFFNFKLFMRNSIKKQSKCIKMYQNPINPFDQKWICNCVLALKNQT